MLCINKRECEFFRCFSQAKSIEEIKWELCQCHPKFPKEEIDFYAEQKFTRKGYITRHLDLKGSQKLQKQEAKNLKRKLEPERQSKQREREAPRFCLADPDQASALICDDPEPVPEPETIDIIKNENDADFSMPEVKPKLRNTHSYENFVTYGKRNDIPNHILAGLMNCLRIDDGETDMSKFCSAKKISNEWDRINAKLSREHLGTSNVICLKADGKKGPSKLAHNKEITIEKITCIQEPEGKYLDHFEPENGDAHTIAQGLFNVVIKYDSVHSLLCIGGDNCPTNSARPTFSCLFELANTT